VDWDIKLCSNQGLGERVNIHFTLLSRWPVLFGIVGGLVEELCGLQSKGSLMEDYKEQEQARYQEIYSFEKF